MKFWLDSDFHCQLIDWKIGSSIEEFSVEGKISWNQERFLNYICWANESELFGKTIIPASAVQLKGSITGMCCLKDVLTSKTHTYLQI